MKHIHVILAFHAHEPLWDFPGQVQALADREEIRVGTTSENYLRKRQNEGRDIYLTALEMAARMRAPLSLEASNELLFQLEQLRPRTFDGLKEGFKSGLLHPVLGHAHHTHVCLLTEDEIQDELRLNSEMLFEHLGIARPAVLGAFPTEDSVDRRKLDAYRRFGVKYLIFPHLDRKKCRFEVTNERGCELPAAEREASYRPFSLERGLFGLPRNFPVSQYIWRPLTRMFPGPLRLQGYLLGDYPVFPDEYRGEGTVGFPISFDDAVKEYAAVLREEIENCPGGGMLLYIQDLELMDFGDQALKIMEAAWSEVIADKAAGIIFSTPQDYFESKENRHSQVTVDFDEVSWAPEIRPVLRVDGHYPPLGAGEVQGVDVIGDYMRTWPFAFWEIGKYFAMLADYLLDQAGFDLLLPVPAGELLSRQYDPGKMEPDIRFRLLGRLIKRACNWGWRPDEARQKRPLIDLYLMAQEMAGRRRISPRGVWTPNQSQWSEIHLGLQVMSEYDLSWRAEYLHDGLARLNWLDSAQQKRLAEVEEHKKNAGKAVGDLAQETAAAKIDTRKTAAAIKDYCRELLTGTEALQQIWAAVPEAGRLVTEMYHQLYGRVPPWILLFLERAYEDNEPERRIGLAKTPVMAP